MLERLADGGVEVVDGASGSGSQPAFQFGEGLLDGIEVRAVGRKVEQPHAGFGQALSDAGDLVSRQVVEDERVARPQLGHEHLLDVSAEALAVHGAVEKPRSDDATRAQTGGDGGRFVMPMRDGNPTALSARCTPVAAGHVGRGGGLVEEDEAVGIEFVLRPEPVFALGLHIRPLLLGGVGCVFLRVMAWRLKKRDRPLWLTVMPRSAKASRSSHRKRVGRSS